MEETMPSSWIQLLYVDSRYNVTEMFSHPFSLFSVLAALLWSSSNFKNGAPFLYPDPGVVAD